MYKCYVSVAEKMPLKDGREGRVKEYNRISILIVVTQQILIVDNPVNKTLNEETD